MNYDDLKPYIVGNDYINPKNLNVGWIDEHVNYPKGRVSKNILDKLLTLTLFDLDQHPTPRKLGVHSHPSGIVVHKMHVRGSPFACPFCKKIVELNDNEGRAMVLGRNEMCIPNQGKSVKFSFPTLLYHYIAVHDYLPPRAFLDALDAFDMKTPYDGMHDGID
jgi:hypothetical protein